MSSKRSISKHLCFPQPRRHSRCLPLTLSPKRMPTGLLHSSRFAQMGRRRRARPATHGRAAHITIRSPQPTIARSVLAHNTQGMRSATERGADLPANSLSVNSASRVPKQPRRRPVSHKSLWGRGLGAMWKRNNGGPNVRAATLRGNHCLQTATGPSLQSDGPASIASSLPPASPAAGSARAYGTGKPLRMLFRICTSPGSDPPLASRSKALSS